MSNEGTVLDASTDNIIYKYGIQAFNNIVI